jgi:tRNA (guanine37-N1)-methyltransferase
LRGGQLIEAPDVPVILGRIRTSVDLEDAAGAQLVIEAVTRLRGGAMGNAASTLTESFGESGLLEEPQFTRPAEFRGWKVPDMLLSGNHAAIEAWRREQSRERTKQRRPDLGA